MPTHFFPLTILTQNYEDETHLAEALNFHEISRFHTNDETAAYDVRVNAEQILKDVYANFLHTRIASETVEIKEFSVEIAPPKKSAAWRENVRLKFYVLQSVREDGYLQAYIPALRIAVLSKKAAGFAEKIEKEIVAALRRDGYTKSLQYLRWLERIESVSLQTEEIAVTLPTAKQRAIAEESDETEEKSVLEEVGTDLTKTNLTAAYEVEKQTAFLAEIFKAKQPSSVLLIGAAGVGKTAIFHELVSNREKLDLKGNGFWATSGTRLIAGQSGFGMWQERCQKLIAEAKKRRAIVHLGNLIELVEVGKSEASMQGIASFLRPKIARGELLAVVECTPEQLPIIERRDPQLLAAFQQIRIEEPDRKTSLKILESVAAEFDNDGTKSNSEAIKIIYALHRRFSVYSAFPGRPVRFTRNILRENKSAETLAPSKVFAEFSNETGLPEMLLNDEIALDLPATERFFDGKVIGQNEAVKLVTDLIATVKAKLTRPRKPIASLLFIGPTGVGKTELTKSLAEFFFSDQSRLIRFDMSEFSNALAVQRLIGGTGEAEGQLTAKVREQPFSVVLLDEFEKADSSFFDLLLQILGEGRLTDAAGRVADFTNSIIVMTSNLGASEFQRGKSGFVNDSRRKQAAVKHFDSAVRAFLRPEIYNRVDRIVPFAPLDEKTVVKIAELEIEKLKRRDGLRFRSVKLEVGEDVLSYLAETGYDIRYGARPLKRAVERELLAPLSTELNRRIIDEKLMVKCGLRDGKIALEFVAENEPKKRSAINNLLAAQAEKTAGLRRTMQKFLSSYRLTELGDEIYQIARLQAIELRGKWLSDEDKLRIERKPKIEKFTNNLKSFGAEINRFEDEILLEIYSKTAGENQNHAAEIENKEKILQANLFELLSLQYQKPNEIKLTLFSENSSTLFRLLRLYLSAFKQFNDDIKQILIFTSRKQSEQKPETKLLFDRTIWRKEIKDSEKFTNAAPEDTFGIMLRVEGVLALPRFGAESGVHRFVTGTKSDRILVNSTDAAFEKYEIADELAKRDSLKTQFERRVYDTAQKQVKDLLLNATFSLENTDLPTIFVKMIEDNLQNTATNLIK